MPNAYYLIPNTQSARVVKSVDTQDLKSCGQKWLCGFKSRPGYSEPSEPLKAFLFSGFQTRNNTLKFCRQKKLTVNSSDLT